MRFTTLKRPAEFKRVRGGARWRTPAFIIEGKARPAAHPADASKASPAQAAPAGPRFGFTITRKIGGAVVRNRIRRRLKAALRAIEPHCARPDHDYVVVASRASHDYPFAELKDALRAALKRLDRQTEGRPAARAGGMAKREAGAKAAPMSACAGNARFEKSCSGPAADVQGPLPDDDASQSIRPVGGNRR